MKKILLSLGFLTALGSVGQTATNFNANDCIGNNHDLFTELNSGKVVVITWVMPCVNCVGGAMSAQNAAKSFSASNPGQVVTYIADDYGNSSCNTVNNWCSSNGLSPDAVFTSTAVNMSYYGAAGMPKAIVLGGSAHTLFYNVNGSANISQAAIQNAITNALVTVGIKELPASTISPGLSPNPANNEFTITFNANGKLTFEIYSVLGQKVKSVDNVMGNEIKINTESLANGSYFLKLTDGKTTETLKLIIAH